MRMEDCRTARQVAEWNPQGKRRRGRLVSTWKDGIRKSLQKGNLKDGECFRLWALEEGNYVLGLRKTVFTGKFLYIYIYRRKGQYCHAYVWRLYKTGIGLTTGFIGSHTVTVYTLHSSLLQLQLFSEDCCSARILTRNWNCNSLLSCQLTRN
jgi:hypothetical protein